MNTSTLNLVVHTDGASRSNPGHASCAYHVSRKGEIPFKTDKHYLGDRVTNNMAEYTGMERALVCLVELSRSTDSVINIAVYSDSRLVVEQLNGKWRVKQHDLKAVFARCKSNLETLHGRGCQVSISWISSDENFLADQLCNQALDEALACQ